jgi:hypothetical protein
MVYFGTVSVAFVLKSLLTHLCGPQNPVAAVVVSKGDVKRDRIPQV